MISKTANSILDFSKLVDDVLFENSMSFPVQKSISPNRNKDVNENTAMIGCKAFNCVNFNEGFASFCKLSQVSLSESGSCNQFQLRTDIDVN